MNGPLLELHRIGKHFGGPPVLQDISLAIQPGQITAIVGENGAGKSTLMKIIAGVYKPNSGWLSWKGRRTDLSSPQQAHELGVSVVYQELNLIPELTVADNLFLAHEPVRVRGLRAFSPLDKRLIKREAAASLARIGAASISPDQTVASLNQANKQMVEIAKALTRNCQLLILDEPTSSLSPPEVEALMAIMTSLRSQGHAILFITHRLEEILRIADRTVILRDGLLVGDLSRAQMTIETMIRLMVGRPLSQHFVREKHSMGPILLEAEHLTINGIIQDVSFQLRAGEILGLAGLVGAGRTDVTRALFGITPLDSGRIIVNGHATKIRSPRDAIRAGLALVPEDRKSHGILGHMAVMENISLPWMPKMTRSGLLNWTILRSAAVDQVNDLTIRPPDIGKPVGYLSGGNQQKVVLGKWLSDPPRVLILDEPTRGVDVGAKHEIYRVINDLAGKGMGILLVSSELPEILGLSTRVLVMAGGRVVSELDNEGLTQEQVISAATVGRM